MRFSGFDDGGWWLEVEGCRGVEITIVSRKTGRNQPKLAGLAAGHGGGKEERNHPRED